jgi:hypothetical protein
MESVEENRLALLFLHYIGRYLIARSSRHDNNQCKDNYMVLLMKRSSMVVVTSSAASIPATTCVVSIPDLVSELSWNNEVNR